MEAISVAGSVVGILSVSAKLATGLTELIERGKNVPESIHSLVSELNDMRGCLAQLRPFLQDTQRSSISRTAMISLDQVVTINTSCVLTLSELEKFIDSFKGRQSLSRIDRLRVSMQEARTATETLISTVEGIRTSSQDVSRRLAALELQSAQQFADNESAHHIRPLAQSMDQVGGTTSQGNTLYTEIVTKAGSPQRQSDADHGHALLGIQDPAAIPNAESDSRPLPNDLELLLQCSRPYSRLQLGFQKLSQSSASHFTGLDTVMTGISLSAFDEGADESGMSTLMKQMQIAYAPETITPTERENVREELSANLVCAFRIALEMIIESGWHYEEEDSTAAANDFLDIYHYSTHSPYSLPIANKLLSSMEILWWDPTFQKALSRGHEYAQRQLFLQRRAISIGDFLRVRIKTRCVTEKLFETRNFLYQVIDVDGERCARRDWIHTWDGADCLFFVASLAGYNRCLIEDTRASLLAANTFKEGFKAGSIVLILNKVDVFMQQIQEHPLRTWFPDFVGREKDYEAALSYIVAKFKAAKKLYDEREIDIYYTDATNIEACQATLRDIENTVMSRRPQIREGRKFASINVSDVTKMRQVMD
ncbi:MAG: hypothetical protein Q9166_007932 [cf. Caloplaca sp. 2 TL-2023]